MLGLHAARINLEASGEILSDWKDCLRHDMRLTTRSCPGVSHPAGSAIDPGKTEELVTIQTSVATARFPAAKLRERTIGSWGNFSPQTGPIKAIKTVKI